jgi:hypothetical protein
VFGEDVVVCYCLRQLMRTYMYILCQAAVNHVCLHATLPAGDPTRQSSSSSSAHWGSMCSILDHHNVVWLGDLNYRLTCSDEEARK